MSAAATPSPSPAISAQPAADDDMISVSSGDMSAEEETDLDDLSFRPSLIHGDWEDLNQESRFTLALLVPSSSCRESGDHSFRVLPRGRVLEITVRWSRGLRDPTYLHKLRLTTDIQFPPSPPCMYAFREFLRRHSSPSDAPIYSTCRLKLPVKAKEAETILRENTDVIDFVTGEIVLYVTLHTPDRSYTSNPGTQLRRLTVAFD